MVRFYFIFYQILSLLILVKYQRTLSAIVILTEQRFQTFQIFFFDLCFDYIAKKCDPCLNKI